MRIIAYQTFYNKDNDVVIEESTGETVTSSDSDDLFSFLLNTFDDEGTDYKHKVIRVCWSLNETVAPLLKLLGEANCKVLWETGKLKLIPYSFFYVADKVFSAENIQAQVRMDLYELQQFFPDVDEPDNLEDIQNYGELLMRALAEMKLFPTKLTSPIGIYEQCVFSHVDLPTVNDIPKEVVPLALSCSGKLWIQAFAVGFFPTVFDMDLVSSFPTVAKNLIDIRHCQWIRSVEYQTKAYYGYAKCKVTIYDWVMVSPILKNEDDGSLISPCGIWEQCLTKGEIDFVNKWKIGQVEILDAWWAVPTKMVKPLEIIISRLLEYKKRTGLVSQLAKRMAVGQYGRYGQVFKSGELGKNFNPIYFSEISTQARIEVAEFLYSHEIGPGNNEGYSHLLAVAVDGFLSDKEVNLK